tara:strand:+ start:6584 stop:7330 length:747 start_codon:yes stop_codon:yes gene_type:complete
MILISPAKRLSERAVERKLALTEPSFKSDADKLAKSLSKLSIKEVQNLMNVSEDIATLNHKRYNNWNLSNHSEKRAIFQFEGDVFKNLDVQSLNDDDLEYMNDNLRILSGIYGYLKPSDNMNPYRLEMGTKSLPDKISTLYEFWGDRVAKEVIKESGSKLIFNLASDEYFNVVKNYLINERVINFKFYTEKNNIRKVIGVIAKRVRGEMARFLILNRVKTLEPIKEFNSMGFNFEELVGNELVFVQKS